MFRAELINPTIQRVLRTFRLDKAYARGAGHYLYDTDGRGYLDFIAQYGAVPFGYNPEDLWQAVLDFHRSGMPAMVQPSVPIKAVELAERLAAIAPGDLQYSTFVQSGAEAVEAAIKLARSATGRACVVSTDNGFHGKTLGALSATGREVYQAPFRAPVSGFLRVPFGDARALEAVFRNIGDDVAAFIVEPVQGEGGIIAAPPGYLTEVADLCRRHGVVFILDEVQTGLGRTGRMFACQAEGVAPDILLLSKALGGGLVPLGVSLSSPRVWNDEYGRLHSSTFANNNLTCAVGLAVLDRLEADGGALLEQVQQKGHYLLEGLRRIEERWPGVIREVRGTGLMVGVEFCEFTERDGFDMVYMSRRGAFCALVAGMLLNVFGIRCAPFLNNAMTLRLEPPLTIEYAEIDRLLQALERICEIIWNKDYALLYRYLVGDDREPTVVTGYRTGATAVRSSRLEPGTRPERCFAFVIHYPGTEDVVKNNPSFASYTTEELERLLQWQAQEPEPEVVCEMPAVRSRTGSVARGWLIGVPFGAQQMMTLPREVTVGAIRRAVDLAREMGAEIVGLGAYTSVVTRGGRDVQGRGVAITSGNSFTIAMALEALWHGAELMGTDLEKARGAVVGAAGSIGRVSAILLSERVAWVSLVGNPTRPNSSLRRLQGVADDMVAHACRRLRAGDGRGLAGWLQGLQRRLRENLATIDPGLYHQVQKVVDGEEAGERPAQVMSRAAAALGEEFPVALTLDLETGLRDADVVLAASNSPGYLVYPHMLKAGAVVCDIARPADVSPAVNAQRPDVLVLEGGLVQLPDGISFGPNMGYRPGVNLACLSETILLSLEGDHADHSIGSRIPLEEVEYLRHLGEKHGFALASLHSAGREITPEEVASIRRVARQGLRAAGV
ncbi:MAG: aminotransferase class III-fold pyridoxal phosphate-dependent enzyme [Syntrophomonadaceae bacterium]|nr:aminotransferase class III-fold pyridoxal phosphate-dependent enzyme [Syntrophomonadaceae bacterium]